MATAILGSSLVTFVGAEPGDVLPVLDTTRVPASPPFAWAITSLPPDPLPGDAGAANFVSVRSACGNTGFFVSNGLPQTYTNCTWDGPLPVLLVAQGKSGFLSAFASSKTESSPGDGGPVDLAFASETWTTPSTVSVDVAHGDSASLQIVQADYADDFPMLADSLDNVSLDPDSGIVSADFFGYPGFADYVVTEVGFLSGNTPGVLVAVRNDSAPTSVSVDFSPTLPRILSAGFDMLTDPSRPTLSWTSVGDAVMANGSYVHATIGGLDWTFVVPPGTTTLQAPELPMVDGGPVVSGVTAGTLVATIAVDGMNGYGPFRQLGTSLMPNPQNSPIAPPLPKDGMVYRAAWLANF
jgi:hypothetical protein